MPRARLLKPEFFKDATLYQAEVATGYPLDPNGYPLRLIYEGLWCQADREGRFQWKPLELKVDILPYDPVDFAAALDRLAQAGFIRRYTVDGKDYGVIPNLVRHQHFHVREPASKLPAPPERRGNGPAPLETPAPDKPGASTGPTPGKPRSSTPDTDTDTDTEGDIHTSADAAEEALFADAWSRYPKRPNNSRAKAWRAWKARRKEGIAAGDLLAGVIAYAAYVQREGTEPRYVRLAATFFGPDRHWETDYSPAASPDIEPYDERGEMSPAMARAMGIAL